MTTAIRGTQVYLTEHTLVYVNPEPKPLITRIGIPLSNIASVMVHPADGVMTINIKPTANQVKMNVEHTIARGLVQSRTGTLTTILPTGSLVIIHVYNAEEFAQVIRGHLD